MIARKMRARRAIAAAALSGFAAVAATPLAAQEESICISAAEQNLQSLGVTPSSIERTDLVTDYLNFEMGTVRKFEAWTKLDSCKGSVVTKLDWTCEVVETYNTGECRVATLTR